MTDNDTQFRLTRRRALTGAAWSAPVIVVASAVPAFAASPSTSLVLNRGNSAAVVGTDGADSYYDLRFEGLSVVVPSTVTAGQLRLTVTYTPATPGGPSGMVVMATPAGFTSTPSSGAATSVVLAYNAGVAGGSEVQVPDGVFIGGGDTTAVQSGSYVVTASAPGLTSAVQSFATPSARPSRGTAPYRRPAV